MKIHGVDRTQGEVGEFLSQVLAWPCPAACDSAKVAGCFEWLRTQGLWAESVRLVRRS